MAACNKEDFFDERWSMINLRRWSFVLLVLLCGQPSLFAQAVKQPLIPHAQDRPPNEPRDAVTAAKLMTVPDGFNVEIVAAEPDIVNPVAMAIDDRGRFWITESLEYPRREPGPGQDRVKILEDTDGDGKADRFTVFMDGLNIPSGVAVGYGGVWVANSPDILFVQDTDGDGKADRQEVIVTGFGRTDTHELPNSLTWGPDGWLYGLNGVFNHSHVRYPKNNPNYDEKHPGWPITCALFRIHPRTREFQVFCEGTSNPWGIAYNNDGEAFVSACVIDHLWHLFETGYYHRQGGPYPPFTWKIESIVKHKHQKAAYCGIHFFDSDAYPEKYRQKLFMGNIHGGCINVDRIESHGATYQGFGEPDFLTANDSWFMPVVQKTGPDGSLYILDWYDRYHCYQDANRDPAGIDRLKGRLYRVRYQDTPRVPKGFDLAKESDDALIKRLGDKNDFLRDSARRILQERNSPATADELLKRLTNRSTESSSGDLHRRMLMTLGGMSGPPLDRLLTSKFDDPDPVIRSWWIRLAGDHATGTINLVDLHQRLQGHTSGREWAQAVVTAAKVMRVRCDSDPAVIDQGFQIFFAALGKAEDDPLIPRIVWQNLYPWLEKHADQFVAGLMNPDAKTNEPLMSLMPRTIERLLSLKTFDAKPIAKIITLLADQKPAIGALCLGQIAVKVQNRELHPDQIADTRQAIEPTLHTILNGSHDSPQYLHAAFLGASWNDPAGVTAVRSVLNSNDYAPEQRLMALNALITVNDAGLVGAITQILDAPSTSAGLKSQILAALSRLDNPKISGIILERYGNLDADLQPRAIELLTQRADWAKQLLIAIGEKRIPATAINLNQARRLKELKDDELTKLLTVHWGQVREGRDPDREKYVAGMRQLVRSRPGDPFAGEKAFKKICGQCHKIYGEGAEVGPDITLNGRNDFNQLLSNVFDPSLVIGAGYRSYTVITQQGRVLNGLLVEDSPQRIVLKLQGGKQEVIARDDVDEFKVNELSLMPEQLEKQLTSQEIIDLFAFLTLDKHPSDKTARKLAGSVEAAPRETTAAAEFTAVVNEVLPGFSTKASGELGVGIVKEHFGRGGVLRTHPLSTDSPCVLSGSFPIPGGKKTSLLIDVSHDPKGDWMLIVRANGKTVLRQEVSPKTCPRGWGTFKVDLSQFAGQTVNLELQNAASGWSWEFGYWSSVSLISE